MNANKENVEKNYPMSDWRYEVANGDTKLGYAEWLEHRREAEDDVGETCRRASLVIGVYDAMLDGTDTFEGGIGSDVAYFMGEVLKGDKFQVWLGANDEFVRAL